MVRRLIRYLNREILGLHQAAFLLAFFALSSQILALVRDRLLAHTFGAGADLDIYYAAFRIPDFVFITVASIVSVSILVPFLVEKLKDGTEEAKRFVDQIFTFFFAIILVVCGALFFFASPLLGFVFPGFSDSEHELLVTLTRIMLLSPIILGVSNLLGSISQTYRRFFLYALSPVLYNLGIIFGIVFLAPEWGVIGVAVGVIGGAVMHLVIHIPFVLKKGLFPCPRLRLDSGVLRSVALLSVPRTFTLGITHLTILVLLSMASLMAEGSISVFNFSFNLQSVILSIVGVSYSLAAFPTLTRLFSEERKKEFLEYLTTSAQHIIFWSIPAAVLFIVMRAQIVRVVLGTGEFDWEATQLTAAALGLFVISVVFHGLIHLFIKTYYAMSNTVLPLIVSLFSGIFGIGSAFTFVFFFERMESFRFFIEALLRVEGLDGTEVLMLPLGFSLGIILNGILFWIYLERDFRGFSRPVLRTLSQSLAAAILGGGAAYVTLGVYSLFIDLTTLLAVLLQGFVAGLVGLSVNILTLILLKNEEIVIVADTLKRRFWKAKVVGPDANVVQ